MEYVTNVVHIVYLELAYLSCQLYLWETYLWSFKQHLQKYMFRISSIAKFIINDNLNRNYSRMITRIYPVNTRDKTKISAIFIKCQNKNIWNLFWMGYLSKKFFITTIFDLEMWNILIEKIKLETDYNNGKFWKFSYTKIIENFYIFQLRIRTEL